MARRRHARRCRSAAGGAGLAQEPLPSLNASPCALWIPAAAPNAAVDASLQLQHRPRRRQVLRTLHLQRQLRLLRATLAALPDAHVLLRPLRQGGQGIIDFRVEHANPAACAAVARADAAAVQLPAAVRCGPGQHLRGRRLAQLLPVGVDRALVLQALGRCLSQGEPLLLDGLPFPQPGGPCFLDLRVVRVDDRLSCLWRDVTDRVLASRRLAESERHYRLLAENSSDVVILLTGWGRVRWVSPSLTAMLGWQPSEWLGRRGSDFLAQRVPAHRYRAVRQRLQQGQTVLLREQVLARDGHPHWVEVHASPCRAAGQALGGGISGIVASFRTVDQEVANERELDRRGRFDGLTDLLNRREVFERIEALRHQQHRSGRQLALLFCDLDRFKAINDNHGHQVGDEVLCAVAQRLRSCLRSDDDLAARVGGDELLVVLRGVRDLANAVAVAELLRRSVAEPIPTSAGALRLTLSIGVTLSSPQESTDALVARADAAMYRAKQAGRDQVIPIDPLQG